jgi:predicted Zn-dependent protease with MMP-like domain
MTCLTHSAYTVTQKKFEALSGDIITFVDDYKEQSYLDEYNEQNEAKIVGSC